jgi:hypothetical protein
VSTLPHYVELATRDRLLSVVLIDSDVPSSDVDTDESLMESDTGSLREIDNRIRAVGSNSRHEDQPSLTVVNRLGRLDCGRREATPDEFAKAIDISRFESAVFRVRQIDKMHGLTDRAF